MSRFEYFYWLLGVTSEQFYDSAPVGEDAFITYCMGEEL